MRSSAQLRYVDFGAPVDLDSAISEQVTRNVTSAVERAQELSLSIRLGVILGGALLGWAVPIAIAARIG